MPVQSIIFTFNADKPKVVQLAHQSHGVLGEEFKITCSATNDRDAQDMTFVWIVPDGVDNFVIMTGKDDHYTASSTLYISKLARSDYGTYKCLVTNNGTKNESVVTSTVVIVEGLCMNILIVIMKYYIVSRTFVPTTECNCYQ